MYRMPLNYNSEKTINNPKMTKNNVKAEDTTSVKSIWNQTFSVAAKKNTKVEETVNSGDSSFTADAMSSEDAKKSNDNVYSKEFFDQYNSMKYKNKNENESFLDFTKMSPKRLQEAFLWSEILGEPVGKRRKRR